MKSRILLFLAGLLTIISCTVNEEIPVDDENLLLGNWANSRYNIDDNTVSYERVANLKDDDYGMSFKVSNVYVERTAGWCGTPPLIFFDSEGTYVFENNAIRIKNDFFPESINWTVVSLTSEKLVLTIELSDQEKEHQELMDLFTEIQNLSESITCSNELDWNFTAYGSKACGGPQGYIAYSNQIDVENFLSKVQQYTNLEDVYNQKWNIISTCDFQNPPVEVICNEGKPLLLYNQTL